MTNEQNHLLECMGNRPRKPVLQDTQSQTVHRVRGCGSEYSTRSRGLLYLATAVHAAAAESANVVRVPENGQLALNPPLTASRTGSLSTRSVHPWTLHQLNRLIEEIAEGEQPVRVENPFAMMTKAEVCRAAASAGQQLQESTVSCGASPRRRLGSSNAAHCGACFPCLVRRSSLLHTFGDDRTEYLTDPWRNGIESGTEHWSALRRWLDREFTEVDLVTDTPLPPDADAAALTGVVEKGRNELRQFVEWAQAGEVRPGQG
ncbi:7-cyano-7-deazaguanine synthase [Streptomyces xiaopingdaonensis]|uniref:7-cyano-7-deazaguanine synthase n=1 Tax=Streptomyces xiaopingdaonensis TaxID=1565415 RepID=UPI000363A7B5|nr:7-cyano-7-deazaguanine synthase [Streptomyces xiaopingdaonensis]